MLCVDGKVRAKWYDASLLRTYGVGCVDVRCVGGYKNKTSSGDIQKTGDSDGDGGHSRLYFLDPNL